MEAQSSRQIISTFKLMRPADDYHEQLYLTLIPLKVVLATQCVFLAHACQQLQDAGIARIKKQFAYTWEKRISAYYQSPVAIAADAGADALAEQRQFKVGIVGAGFMGGQVARTMLDAGFEPTQLLLATRTPSRQKELAARGVHLVTDLESVASRAHVLFLCVLPAHLQDVSRGLRKSVSRQTLVVSLVAGVTRVKLEQMLDSPAAFVLNSEETLTALRASRIGLPGQGGAPPAAPMKQLTPHLLRLSAASLAPELSGLVDLVRAMPVVLTGLELPEGDSRTACLEALLDYKSDTDVASASELLGPLMGGTPLAEVLAATDRAQIKADRVLELLAMRFEQVLQPLLGGPSLTEEATVQKVATGDTSISGFNALR